VLEFDPDLRGGDGFALARDILDSGRARLTMAAIIEAQGARGFDWRNPPLAAMTHEVSASAAGVVTAIDCERLSRIARLAGAPNAAGAGVDLLRRIGDRVASGEPLYRIYADTMAELQFAREVASRASGFRVGDAAQPEPSTEFAPEF
jgi:thymidine phosphorylase